MSALLRKSVDVALLLRLARRLDVGLYSLEPFYHGQRSRNGLFFGFGAIDTIDMDTALDRVRDVLMQVS